MPAIGRVSDLGYLTTPRWKRRLFLRPNRSGAPCIQRRGTTNYQEERARRLEHVLAKEHQVTHIHAYYLSEGQVTAVSWPNDEGGRSSVRLNAAMVAALRGIDVTLITDLRRTGADARALHLVEQQRKHDAAWSQQYEPGTSRESQRGASSFGLDHERP